MTIIADCFLSEVHLRLCSGTLKGAATQTKRKRCTSQGLQAAVPITLVTTAEPSSQKPGFFGSM
ncbi:hypothetical protein [Microseira wollei]|uniref:hypothetical protein n=1 Tax=Microseira wollei TaxID=467598 RepID=UPI001CFDC28F|nr:hypothetical protein [Microseira wollei]